MAIVASLLLSSLLNVVYYAPVLIRGWFGGTSHDDGGHKKILRREDPSWIMLLPMLLLALGTLFFGLYPDFPLNLAKQVAIFYLGSR